MARGTGWQGIGVRSVTKRGHGVVQGTGRVSGGSEGRVVGLRVGLGMGRVEGRGVVSMELWH